LYYHYDVRTLVLSIILLGFCLARAGAQVDQALNALSAVHQFREVAMSEDGVMLAWIETIPAKNGSDSSRAAVFVKNLRDAGAATRTIMDAGESAQGLAWSRDGKLAFIANTDSEKQLQLYVAEKPGRGKPRKVTDVEGYLAEPHWSPDGRSIAILWMEGVTHIPGPTEATVPDVGVVASQIHLQRLALVNPATGVPRVISPNGMHVYESDWSPDGKELAYLAAPGPGDDNWYIAELYAVDAESGAVKHILKPSMQVANVRWSPDGKSIAFIGGLMSDEGSTGGDIYALPAGGGAVQDLTPHRKSSPNWFRWTPSSKQILMTEDISGNMAVSTVDLASGSIETLWKGEHSIVFSGDANTSAMIRSSWDHASEVWAGHTGSWQQITHSNDNRPAVWGEAKSVEWKNDGLTVQGWLMFPQPYDPGRHYPMIVLVHGGPAADTRPSWPRPGLPVQLFSAQGYFLFFPNPRGSYGQGEEFTRGNVRDFGHGDLSDILTGVDSVVKNYPVDDRRVGIAGWSYGGYMTMWAVTQTNRFRAAFAGAGIANLQSYYGENSIDQWMLPYFGASVYDDPEVYARSSPINFIKNVKTPTLIAVGERDGECPVPQSYEFWHALNTLGVKTEFVIYPGEGHSFRDPEHRRDLFQRVVKWFQDNMPVSEVK
jgi:dipeptidyl aminopeptidase/acylaminoacyl peptidase